jgi:hypothetical protein
MIVTFYQWGSFYNTKNSLLWNDDNPHETVKSNYQHHFSMNMYDQLVGLYIFPTSGKWLLDGNFLQHQLLVLC